ncbi:MAG: type II secretion system F family protein [Planctomycetota bacterium]
MLIVYITMAFFAGFAFIAAMNYFLIEVFVDRRTHQATRMKEEIRLRNAERARIEFDSKEAQQKAVSQIAQYYENPSLWAKWKLIVAQSGIVGVRPEAFVAMAACVTLLVAAVSGFLLKSISIGILCGFGAGFLPFAFVLVKRKQRQQKLLSQLPDAYEMLARVLRSGQTVSQAMRAIADEFTSPLAEEFAYCWEQQNLGLTPEASLKELAKRTGLLEVKIFVVALTINSTAGGNLSQLLNKLSHVIRDREKMRQKVMALTAEGRMQAYMMIALPIGLAGMLSVLSPTYLLPLLEFKPLIAGTVVWMGVGYFWMQRIINFDQ